MRLVERMHDSPARGRAGDDRAKRLPGCDVRTGHGDIAATGVGETGIAQCLRYVECVGGEQDLLTRALPGGAGRYRWQPPTHAGREVALQQAQGPVLPPDGFVQRHRRRRPRIDFEQREPIVVEQKIAAVDADEPRVPADFADSLAQLGAQTRRQLDWPDGARMHERQSVDRDVQFVGKSEHRGRAARGDEQRRAGFAPRPALEVAGRQRNGACFSGRSDMCAAAAVGPFDEPVGGGPVRARERDGRVRHAERVEQREKPPWLAHGAARLGTVTDERGQARKPCEFVDERFGPAARNPACHARQAGDAAQRIDEAIAIDREPVARDVEPQRRGRACIAIAEDIERGCPQPRSMRGLGEHACRQRRDRNERCAA